MFKKFIPIACLATLVSCNNNNTPATVETKTDSVKQGAVEQPTNDLADFEFHTLVINIPSPFEIVSQLPKGGFLYNKELINPSDNASKYATSTKRALNYGAYIVDLIYLSSNEQYSQVKNYFKTSRDLAVSLQCADSFDKIAGNRLEKNIDKKDTINKVIDQLYIEMDNYLRGNDRLLTATQILVGSWIESQYITLSITKDEAKTKLNELLYQKIAQQNYTAEKLEELLKEYEKEKDFIPLINEVKELHKIYSEYKGGEMSKEMLNKIYDKVKVTRNKVVN